LRLQPGADARVRDRFQRRARLRVGEHQFAQARTLQSALRIDEVGAEASHDFRQRRLARRHDRMGDRIGVRHHHAARREQGRHRRLARGDAPGDGDDEGAHPAAGADQRMTCENRSNWK